MESKHNQLHVVSLLPEAKHLTSEKETYAQNLYKNKQPWSCNLVYLSCLWIKSLIFLYLNVFSLGSK